MSARPVSRNGGTCARATPSEASVAQSAIAPSASGRRHRARVRRRGTIQRLGARSARRACRSARRATRGCAAAPTIQRPSSAPSRRRRARELACISAAHSRRRGRSASMRVEPALDRPPPTDAPPPRAAPARAPAPRRWLRQARDRERRAALRAAASSRPAAAPHRRRRTAARLLAARRQDVVRRGASSGSSARRARESSRLGDDGTRAARVRADVAPQSTHSMRRVAQQTGATTSAATSAAADPFLEELGERLVGAVAAHALQLRRAAPARLVVRERKRRRRSAGSARRRAAARAAGRARRPSRRSARAVPAAARRAVSVPSNQTRSQLRHRSRSTLRP